jgi:hypothetical protein
VSRQFKSVYTLQGKNLTNTSYACPLGSHVQQPYVKSLLSQNWAPFSGMKSWPPAIVRPDRRPGLLHALSNEPPQSWEGWFDKVVTGLLGLPGPINSICGQYKSNVVHQGQNDAVLKRHRWELPPWNLRIATALSPLFPSEWSTFPYLPCPVTTTYMNINIASTHHNQDILLIVWDLPLVFYRWLSTKHSRSNRKNVNTSKPRLHMEGYYHATYHNIIQDPTRNAQYITCKII